jgi:hypothetical protein
VLFLLILIPKEIKFKLINRLLNEKRESVSAVPFSYQFFLSTPLLYLTTSLSTVSDPLWMESNPCGVVQAFRGRYQGLTPPVRVELRMVLNVMTTDGRSCCHLNQTADSGCFMVISQKVVIPAKAGIQSVCSRLKFLVSAFAGKTNK